MAGSGNKAHPHIAPPAVEARPKGQALPPFRPLRNIDVRLMSLLDMAADSIVLMDAQSRILLFNKASETLFGYDAEDVIGKSVNILMPPKYADHHDAWVDTYLETGRHSIIGIGREVQGKHKDGTTFPFDLSVGVTETDDGKQFIGVMRDLRARKQVEEKLRTLQHELNQMTRINAMDEMGATVAHELNQPLTAIILYLQAIERKLQSVGDDAPLLAAEATQLAELSGRAVHEAQRSSTLLQRIRSIIEKDEPERRHCEIVSLIHHARELALVGFAATDIDIYIDVDPGLDAGALPHVLVDPVQIEQIMLNLFRNAFQAMRDRDQKIIRITLGIAAEEKDRRERLAIRFKDSGPGIPDSEREGLFKAFGSKRRNGMGLGLAIARSIAQNHGGSLELAPFDETQPGACFILNLPSATPPSEMDKKQEDPASLSRNNGGDQYQGPDSEIK